MSDDEDSKLDEDEEVDEEEEEVDEEEEEMVEDVDIEPELNSQLEESHSQSEYLGDYYNQFEDNKEYIKTYHPEELHLSFEEIYNL